MIGNKHTELKREIVKVEEAKAHIPCGAIMIESVHVPYVDHQSSSSSSNAPLVENAYIEKYSDL